jgi:hypothetical protein
MSLNYEGVGYPLDIVGLWIHQGLWLLIYSNHDAPEDLAYND